MQRDRDYIWHHLALWAVCFFAGYISHAVVYPIVSQLLIR